MSAARAARGVSRAVTARFLYRPTYRRLPRRRILGVVARRKDWDAHVAEGELVARTPSFQAMREHVLQAAQPRATDTAADPGAGTGLLTLALADRVESVWAIDRSPAPPAARPTVRTSRPASTGAAR